MTLARLVMVGALLLAGCTTRVLDIAGEDWDRPNTAIQQETFDEVECARATEPLATSPTTIVGGIIDAFAVPLADVRRGAAYDRCMREKGYVPSHSRSTQAAQ